MSDATGIQWTDATWNPVRGCSIVSPGCANCYAMSQAHRFDYDGGPYEGLTKAPGCACKRPGQIGDRGECSECGREMGRTGKPVWSGKITLLPDLLDKPLRWRKPRRIFVNSMSDLFHEDVPDEFIDQVFAVMACAPHTFQILTKRPDRMRAYLREHAAGGRHVWVAAQAVRMPRGKHKPDRGWPLPNVWLGVSCEDQKAADERIPILLETPAAVRFVSAEPLLGPISFRWMCAWPENAPTTAQNPSGRTNHLDGLRRLDWVIVGGESGPRSRLCDFEWIRSIVQQCQGADVPVFVKQIGARPWVDVGTPDGDLRDECDDDVSRWFHGAPVRWDDNLEGWFVRPRDRAGSDPAEWPEDLRIREFPR